MLRLAVKGTSLEGLAEQFKGDTAIAFAHEADPMSAARILCKYQDGDKSKKFVVKAGFMEGKVMDLSLIHISRQLRLPLLALLWVRRVSTSWHSPRSSTSVPRTRWVM